MLAGWLADWLRLVRKCVTYKICNMLRRFVELFQIICLHANQIDPNATRNGDTIREPDQKFECILQFRSSQITIDLSAQLSAHD